MLEKPSEKIQELLQKKSSQYTELDFYILLMIKLNAHSKTSPWDLEIVDQEYDSQDTELIMLQKYHQSLEIMDSLEIGQEKDIFSWKFFPVFRKKHPF
ncbi:MAG TPA: hypothetical protein ENI20_14475 [Bacteroides sp.]|nr:hypothetical protein [Bacteroides sp.]